MKKIEEYDFVAGEILLVNKPLEWSSFDAVRKLKRLVGAKIGHAGTLDPLATGLMIMGTGKKTKALTELQNLDKEYTGIFFLGATTPSFDRESEVDKSWEIEHISEEDIYKAAESFVGGYAQLPPMFSAIKIGGTRAYKLARRGETADIKTRDIKIDEFEITRIEGNHIHFRVVVSKGTYIRSLANDFGERLGVGAYLHTLCRTRVGEYKLQDAWDIHELVEVLQARINAAIANEDL
ncbi:MAG: tRNA pseudouridine(55) synthase TruB [Bacteroidia bacterium]